MCASFNGGEEAFAYTSIISISQITTQPNNFGDQKDIVFDISVLYLIVEHILGFESIYIHQLPATMKFPAVLIVTALWSAQGFAPVSRHSTTTTFRPLYMAEETAAVTVRRLPDSVVEIDIPVPGSATKAAYDKVCRELSKNIQIPGFRKGSRIPPQVLEQSMAAKGGRNALKVQAINELMQQLVEQALKDQSLEPIGQAALKIPAEELADSYKPGEDLTLPVRCDVWPEIQWKDTGKEKAYVGLKGKYTRKPFDQKKLDAALRDLKERYVTLEPVTESDYALQMGDSCFVNMNGFMATDSGEKGEPLPNAASGDRVEVVLGPGRYMEGLVEGLVGAKVGESRTVTVSFPEVSFRIAIIVVFTVLEMDSLSYTCDSYRY